MFSHDENSAGYSACDEKYGDCQGQNYYTGSIPSSPWAASRVFSIRNILIENKIKPTTMNCWFHMIGNVSEIPTINNIDTSQCTSMIGTFGFMDNLEAINVSSWDTSEVTNMNGLFESCGKLKSLDFSGWNTSKSNSFRNMFGYCYDLTSINYGSNFTKKEGCDINGMYQSCSANKPSWW